MRGYRGNIPKPLAFHDDHAGQSSLAWSVRPSPHGRSLKLYVSIREDVYTYTHIFVVVVVVFIVVVVVVVIVVIIVVYMFLSSMVPYIFGWPPPNATLRGFT